MIKLHSIAASGQSQLEPRRQHHWLETERRKHAELQRRCPPTSEASRGGIKEDLDLTKVSCAVLIIT